MSKQVTIKMSVATGKVGSECEDEIQIDRAEWDAMTNAQKVEYLEDLYTDHRQNYVEGWVHAYDENGVCLSEKL